MNIGRLVSRLAKAQFLRKIIESPACKFRNVISSNCSVFYDKVLRTTIMISESEDNATHAPILTSSLLEAAELRMRSLQFAAQWQGRPL